DDPANGFKYSCHGNLRYSSCHSHYRPHSFCTASPWKAARKAGGKIMIYWQIFLANFTSNLLGYGGGPATIPLLEHEVVDNYHWFTTHEFSQMVALGNGLPGPIATKLAAYVGYDQAGIVGASIGVFASVAPSLIMMIALLGLLMR